MSERAVEDIFFAVVLLYKERWGPHVRSRIDSSSVVYHRSMLNVKLRIPIVKKIKQRIIHKEIKKK